MAILKPKYLATRATGELYATVCSAAKSQQMTKADWVNAAIHEKLARDCAKPMHDMDEALVRGHVMPFSMNQQTVITFDIAEMQRTQMEAWKRSFELSKEVIPLIEGLSILLVKN